MKHEFPAGLFTGVMMHDMPATPRAASDAGQTGSDGATQRVIDRIYRPVCENHRKGSTRRFEHSVGFGRWSF
jgi:hypothetical protein